MESSVAPRCVIVTGKPAIRYSYGEDPDMDAWLTNFFTENHLAYEPFPDIVASPEQLNFIVHMDGEPFYYPCSDKLFDAIISKKADNLLTTSYMQVWGAVEELVRKLIEDPFKQQYLLSLLSIKFQHEISSKVLLPFRMIKRMLSVFTTISEISRPLDQEKELYNQRALDFFTGNRFRDRFNSLSGIDLRQNNTLDELDYQLDIIRLRRLFLLSTISPLWENGDIPTTKTLDDLLDKNKNIDCEVWQWFCDELKDISSGKRQPYILWTGTCSGQIICDLLIISQLMKMGIRVILAVKHGFFFHSISYLDLLEDPVLEPLLKDADFIANQKISKNELLQRLAASNKLLVISDGTRESFNPLLTSVTFARAFKEVDMVICRCRQSRECFMNHFQFTRDLLSIIDDGPGKIDILHKPRHPGAIRFSESSLRRKAEQLIRKVRRAREGGKTCMFYSAIVGSIPGQLEMAKKILDVFVSYLRESMDDVIIINPGEHFEEGMDADDIMYMWEIFQRSGVIDIWRFQNVSDVEKSFQLMGGKVPPEWTGKDATYSTGCTKEMEIAMDIQRKFPEMQLIGPSWEKFQRRKEYGVGKLYDRALAG